MANEKIVSLNHLQIVKDYVDNRDAAAIKSAEYADSTIKLYSSTDKSGEPAAVLNLPEEMFLDQAKTAFVREFSYSAAEYAGAVNPDLDGKPVLVLAVKVDKGAKYAFVSLEGLGAKLSAEEGNVLVMKEDGLYVPAASAQTAVEYATDEEVNALFVD